MAIIHKRMSSIDEYIEDILNITENNYIHSKREKLAKAKILEKDIKGLIKIIEEESTKRGR